MQSLQKLGLIWWQLPCSLLVVFWASLVQILPACSPSLFRFLQETNPKKYFKIDIRTRYFQKVKPNRNRSNLLEHYQLKPKITK